jgi:hypothetical protein
MEKALKKVKDVVMHILITLNKSDPMDILANMQSKERDRLIEFGKQTFVKLHPDRLNMEIFKEFLQEIRKFTYRYFARFINVDHFLSEVSRLKCTHVVSVLDCCRETLTKGAKSVEENTITERLEKQGIVDKEKTRFIGAAATLYAAQDGEKADAGSSDSRFSPMIRAWVTFLLGNKGGMYPDVLAHFAWKDERMCDLKIKSTKAIQFVKGPRKPIKNMEFLEGLAKIVFESFPDEYILAFQKLHNDNIF